MEEPRIDVVPIVKRFGESLRSSRFRFLWTGKFKWISLAVVIFLIVLKAVTQ